MSIIEKLFEKNIDNTSRDSNESVKQGHVKSSIVKEKGSVRAGTAREHEHENSSENIPLDYARLKSFGFLTPDILNITLAEQYRRIKRPILLNAFHGGISGLKNGNLVMVTSSVPGEGKTFSSFNLAMSVANEFNHTVLYIDADVTKQTLTNCLGFSGRPGLTDILIDDSLELSELIVGTDIANLKILPAGVKDDRITELWASERMHELLAEISQRYSDRLVIFDSPPVLHDSSSSILARIVGQVILVVEAEKTPQHVLDETLTTISDSRYIGLILNKSNQKYSSDYGYYAHV